MKRALIGLVAWVALAAIAEAQTVGTCSPGLADAYLEVGNVRARILNNGNLFYRGEPHVYNVPKWSTSNAVFSAGLWIGGMVDGSLRMAASRHGPYEFWPGPLDDDGKPPADCAEYDRIYSVSREQVAEYESSGVAAPDLADWPTGLGAPTLDAGGSEIDLSGLPLAARRDRKIDLAAGERPAFLGDQMVWWVMNDLGNRHLGSEGAPIGVEVHGLAFAFDAPGHVGNATFYRYTIVYRGPVAMDGTHVTLYTDTDLGHFADDWAGSDSLLGLGYVWNSDNFDTPYGASSDDESYGTPPPALGVDFFQGPIVESTGDIARIGSRMVPGFRNLPLTAFMEYDEGEMSPERKAPDFYQFMRARWRDGKRVTVGGQGRDFSDVPTNFMFSGDASRCAYWTACNVDGAGARMHPEDQALVPSTGPFAMQPGSRQDILVGLVFARGRDHFDSVAELKAADSALQRFVDSWFTEWPEVPDGPSGIPTLLSPGNAVDGQPLTLKFAWSCPDDALYCGMDLADRADFESSRGLAKTNEVELDLEPNTTYWWRVRGIGRAEVPGPWSDVHTFDTGTTEFSTGIDDFQVVSNAAGPLDPPECGAFGFNGSGFPLVACGRDRPDGSRQQSGGVLAQTQGWGVHAGGAGVLFGLQAEASTYLARTFRDVSAPPLGPYGFEWRFTAAGGKAKRAFQDGGVMDVPFELWRTQISSPSNPAGDTRLVPVINDMHTLGVFDIGGDHPISGGTDDPTTDWIYWNLPDDDSPGQAGYEAYFAGTGGASREILARQVLVCWDCGSAPPYPQPYPEVGTTFRITTAPLQAPILASPASGAMLVAGDIGFYWSEGNRTESSLQFSRTPDFAAPVITQEESVSGALVALAEPGPYWWRVGSEAYGWSEVWTLQVLPSTSIEAPGDLPTEFALDAVWPNPFNPVASIRFGLPADAVATVDVVDVLGRRVAVIDAGARRAAGWHTVQFDGSRLASGVYFVRLVAGVRLDVKSVVLLK